MTCRSVFQITLFTLCLLIAAAQAQEYDCRRSEEVTRCADEPNEQIKRGGYQWCEYRVCAFSFIPAVECDNNIEVRATHKCSREEVNSAVWRCIDGLQHATFVLPEGCKGDECEDNVKACPCEMARPKRFHYEAMRPSTSEC
eukprot:gb/GEZJ01001129.1/.p1 GENE.gb/GEZJ01001129.1/~~gb/GEZJ01001129.1/.p1  ORF type:complete len:142 (+),score=7.56 gb/GEZJ01001129.1/:464-889(+)